MGERRKEKQKKSTTRYRHFKKNNIKRKNKDYVYIPFNLKHTEVSADFDTEKKFGKLMAHNVIDNNLYTGEINYTIKNETLIFVGNSGSNEEGTPKYFYKNARGEYAVPGSTMSGLIRNNAQILGLANVQNDIELYKDKWSMGESLDLCMSMFGYSHEKMAYKSKLSFSDAIVVGTPKIVTKKYVLMKPDGEESKKDEKIDEGIKMYAIIDEIKAENTGNNEGVVSELNAFDKGTAFSGKIRFKNLSKVEFGLLLWSLKLEKDSWMNVGAAKAFGLGKIKLSIDKVCRFAPEKAYKSNGIEIKRDCLFDELSGGDVDSIIGDYKKAIEPVLGTSVENYKVFRKFFASRRTRQS